MGLMRLRMGNKLILLLSQSCYYFAAMPRLHTYRIVKELPSHAVKVIEYAKQRGCHHSLIYHEVKRKKAKFEIVNFQGINFIIQ